METESKLKSQTTDCSRRSSENSDNSPMASETSTNTISSSGSLGDTTDEEILKLWGQIVNDWPNYLKKQKPLIQVC